MWHLSAHFSRLPNASIDVLACFQWAPGVQKSDMRKLSSGFMGIALAMHLCGQVDAYGFEAKDGHYFQRKREARTAFATRHNWQLERQCMGLLRTRKGLIRFR